MDLEQPGQWKVLLPMAWGWNEIMKLNLNSLPTQTIQWFLSEQKEHIFKHSFKNQKQTEKALHTLPITPNTGTCSQVQPGSATFGTDSKQGLLKSISITTHIPSKANIYPGIRRDRKSREQIHRAPRSPCRQHLHSTKGTIHCSSTSPKQSRMSLYLQPW